MEGRSRQREGVTLLDNSSEAQFVSLRLLPSFPWHVLILNQKAQVLFPLALFLQLKHSNNLAATQLHDGQTTAKKIKPRGIAYTAKAVRGHCSYMIM